jgi:tetratricopeptide (TPR) repeat protein
MNRSISLAAAAFLPLGLLSPVVAGMTEDLAGCTAAQGQASADACTRVMNSGRLPDEQRYIGRFNRGMGYHHAGDYVEALVDFNAALKLNPRFARGYHARAFLKQDLGAFDGALADLAHVIALNPTDWFGFYCRALILRDRGSYQDAILDLDRAFRLEPEENRIELLRALILSDEGKIDAARLMINKVIAQGHDDSAGFYARASVAFNEGRLDAALDDLARVLKLGQDVGIAHVLLGQVLEARGDTAGAIEHYRRALAEPDRTFEGRSPRKLARERLAALERGAEGSPGGAGKE